MKSIFSAIIFTLFSIQLLAQQTQQSYEQTLTDRSDKIVKTLGIADTAVYNKVVGIMVNQYKNLGRIHDSADDKMKSIKSSNAEKSVQEELIKNLTDETNAKLFFLNCAYIGSLSAWLTNDQIEKVKDGMTYGVVQVTYKSYVDMIPSLTTEDKKQLYAWLIEAREYAITAASSEKKHEWFGKYKGRFNNYLSARGYDIKKEREEWQKRLKSGTK